MNSNSSFKGTSSPIVVLRNRAALPITAAALLLTTGCSNSDTQPSATPSNVSSAEAPAATPSFSEADDGCQIVSNDIEQNLVCVNQLGINAGGLFIQASAISTVQGYRTIDLTFEVDGQANLMTGEITDTTVSGIVDGTPTTGVAFSQHIACPEPAGVEEVQVSAKGAIVTYDPAGQPVQIGFSVQSIPFNLREACDQVEISNGPSTEPNGLQRPFTMELS